MKLIVALRVLFLTASTTVLIFLGDKDDVLPSLQEAGYLGEKVNIGYVRVFCFLLGTLVGIFGISIPLYLAKVKIKNDELIIYGILRNSKSDFLRAFCFCIKESSANINIRILVPHKSWLSKLKSWGKRVGIVYNGKTIYKIVDIKHLHNDKTRDDLVFELSPNPQGIVGRVYTEKKIILNFNMRSPTIKSDYNLNDFQFSETSDLRFCGALPILNNKDEVIAIVSFDSKNELTLNSRSKDSLEDVVRNYAKFLHLQFTLLNKN